MLTELKEKHVDAYMKWVVHGAKICFEQDLREHLPKTVLMEIARERKDKKELLETFILKHLKFEQGSFISTEEIREVFLIYEEFDILQDTQTTTQMNTWIKAWLDSTPTTANRTPLICGVKNTKRDFPSRSEERSQPRGYLHLAWKPSEKIANIVNDQVRCNYFNCDLPRIPNASESSSSHSNTAEHEKN